MSHALADLRREVERFRRLELPRSALINSALVIRPSPFRSSDLKIASHLAFMSADGAAGAGGAAICARGGGGGAACCFTGGIVVTGGDDPSGDARVAWAWVCTAGAVTVG